MGRVLKLVATVIALAIVFALAFWLWDFLHSVFKGASDNIKAASITAVATVLTLILGRYLEGRREAQARINLERINIYSDYFDFFFRVFSPEEVSPQRDEIDVAKELRNFQKKFLLWASDEVLNAQDEFNSCLIEFSSRNLKGSVVLDELLPSIRAAAKLLRQMRRDVGYRNTIVTDQHFARMLLKQNDPDTLNLIKKL